MSRDGKTLEEYVSEMCKRGRGLHSALKETWSKLQNGVIKLQDPDPPLTFPSFIFRLDYSLWFWTTLFLTLLTIILVYVSDYIEIVTPARYVLGSIYVLLLPGYSLVEALYPGENDLSPLERLALSIGLSLALVPLIGLLLNYTPWGIRLQPVMASTSIFIVSMLILAAYRKFTNLQYSVKRANKGLRRP